MTVSELKIELERSGIPSHMYSLLIGGFPNEAFCLNKEGELWEVYYSERGKARERTVFKEENEACRYLFGKLKKYTEND